jgi:HAAS domain-containing protein
MKPRSSEAARLEADYLARVRSVLAGRDRSEVEEVIESLREHIEEELSSVAAVEVSLVQMANVLERLGPPELFVPEEASSASGSAWEGVSSAFKGVDFQLPTRIDVGGYMKEAIDLYSQNFLLLLLVSLLVVVLNFCSLFILSGPLAGAFLYMMLCAVRRENKKIELDDMIGIFFRKFFPLLGLMLITILPYLIGFSLFLIPGLLLGTIWIFSSLLIIDKGESIINSLRKSCTIVNRKGFGGNFCVVVLAMVFSFGASLVLQHIVFAISILLGPLSVALIAIAYERQVGQDGGELADLFEPQ